MTRARILADYVAGGSTAAEFDVLDGLTSTTAELNYVDGVTSNVQTQLDAKAPLASPTFTGNFTSVGIDDNANANAITINSSKYVGINTALPTRFLTVNGTTYGPVMEGEMIYSKNFTWDSTTSPSLSATGLTYSSLQASGAIFMIHFYWANSGLTDSWGYSRMYCLYRNDYGGLFSDPIERLYAYRSGTGGFQGYPYISNPGTGGSSTTVVFPFQKTGGGHSSYPAIMYVSVHKIHMSSLHETN